MLGPADAESHRERKRRFLPKPLELVEQCVCDLLTLAGDSCYPQAVHKSGARLEHLADALWVGSRRDELNQIEAMSANSIEHLTRFIARQVRDNETREPGGHGILEKPFDASPHDDRV
jgi:hypothetical protein